MTFSVLKNILVIDDNPINREILRNILELKGFSIVEAKNGKEAIEILGSEKFSLIIIDLIMPGMSGFETTEKIRAMGIKTPILAHSSLSSREDKRRCLQVGCDDFLPKPLDFKKLIEVVNRLIEEGPGDFPDSDDNKSATLNTRIDNKYNILLIEENANTSTEILLILRKACFKVTQVSNGSEAWELLNKGKRLFDLVISNVFTSGIDGLGLVVKIRENIPETPVLLYNSEYDREIFNLALELGADRIIPISKFEGNIWDIIESTIYHSRGKISSLPSLSISRQIRETHSKLVKSGDITKFPEIDIGYMPLYEAGGDMVYFKQFNLAGRKGILLADVSGHDIKSSYISAIMLGISSSTWSMFQEPMPFLKHVNGELLRLDDSSSHICLTSLLWDQRRGIIGMASAGNPGGILLHKENSGKIIYTNYSGGGMCLGMLKREDLFNYNELDFGEGDLLFIFSDGIESEELIEKLKNREDELFSEDISGISQSIIDEMLERSVQTDDMLLIAIKGVKKFPETGFHYYFKSSFENVNPACDWVIEKLKVNPCPKGLDLDFIHLSIREVLLNAVEHGNGLDIEKYVDISMYFSPDELLVEVSDEGRGFDIEEKISEMESQTGFQIGKRGLRLIISISDEVNVEDSTIILHFRKK